MGVIFSDTGNFQLAKEKSIKSTIIASGRILSILHKLDNYCWKNVNGLFQAMAVSVLTYMGEFWSLRCTENIEKVQLIFFKHLLKLPMNTPNYALRIETGRLSLVYNVVKAGLRWLIKIEKMPEIRLPRLCLMRLKHLVDTFPETLVLAA